MAALLQVALNLDSLDAVRVAVESSYDQDAHWIVHLNETPGPCPEGEEEELWSCLRLFGR
jgi:hypothetical protein